MQEHEQALTDALARLADLSDGESGIKLLPTFDAEKMIIQLIFNFFLNCSFEAAVF